MNWILISLQWYFYLLILGLAFYPLAKKIFPFFFDRGYPFAKTLAILFLSYAIFVLGLLKLLPFTQSSLFLLVILFLISLIIYWIKSYKSRIKNQGSKIQNLIIFLFEEALFLISFIFLAFIRGQEPSIHGLEKFMDFGFINSILRSRFFPPLDMWYTPNPINYYYFGHLTGAFLIKLTGITPSIGYNLILATIFAQGITLSFSLTANLVFLFQQKFIKKINLWHVFTTGLIGAFLVNLAGNLHTIYLFTTGYPNDNPIPFWQILSNYNPLKYWYPNATRFIPFTIHEFPSYSYVVADLHGHVFDIPFVILTLAILLRLFIKSTENRDFNSGQNQKSKIKSQNYNSKFKILQPVLTNFNQFQLFSTIFLGFMAAVHYMTNAFDGPIYLLLTAIVFFALFGFSWELIINYFVLFLSFIFFSLPFTLNFSPFVSGIGINCSPDFLVSLGKLGPFLFEKGNCQISPLWMMVVLWGFFWVNFILFLLVKKLRTIKHQEFRIYHLDVFIFILFSFGTFLLIIPEFFYIKDIYPAHFRANTVFKLGYQAFIMMSVASSFVFYQIKFVDKKSGFILRLIFLIVFFFVFLYSFFAFPSYYGKLDRPVNLDGITWLNNQSEDKEIVDFLNKNVPDQPVVLEAQGDSYTDFERISAYTGLPTVAGWWVHEWLWRGSSDVVGKRIPDVVNLYESKDVGLTRSLIKKYNIEYVVVSKLEKEKYKNLNEDKFMQIGRKIFSSTNGLGALYQINK